MSLPTVVPTSHDPGSSTAKTLTLKSGSLAIKEKFDPAGSAEFGRLFGVTVSDVEDLYIRDTITQSIADFLNRAAPAERRAATGSGERIHHATELRVHIMLGVLFLKDPKAGEKLKMMYTPSACRDPYGADLHQLTGLNCLGYIKTIA